MGLLIFALVAALVAFVVIWLVDQVALPSPINTIAKAVVVIIAIAAIAQRAGVV